jgi:hypothetical protein
MKNLIVAQDAMVTGVQKVHRKTRHELEIENLKLRMQVMKWKHEAQMERLHLELVKRPVKIVRIHESDDPWKSTG